MLELFVGDIYETLAIEAQAYNANAFLITPLNLDSFLNDSGGVGYTSLADIGDHELFFQLCNKIDKLYYRPPTKWSHPDQQYYTEHVLAWISQFKNIDGSEYLLKTNQQFSQDFLQDTRKTNQCQLWAVGCSITFGVGVDTEQTYREIISQELNLEHSNLSCPGSSIVWQSDQICRADLRPNDIVIWGLTSQHRIPVFHNNTIIHLNSQLYKKYPELISKFPIDLLDNNTLSYHNVLAVRRAYHFCQKVGAKLVILALVPDFNNLYLHYNVPVFRHLMPVHHLEYIDLGRDNIHPGPKQHKIFAKEFLAFYNQLYT
jgi:hypothetical protein